MPHERAAPSIGRTAFSCPFCNAYARQTWGDLYFRTKSLAPLEKGKSALCEHCNRYTLWFENSLVYPLALAGPLPNSDLPAEIAADFEEARQIASVSPRSAAALLRLAIQKLCIVLGEKGENLNNDIGELVKKGLALQVQKSLDAVRVIGNEAVHPGVIDLKDDTATADVLFRLVNFIAEKMISEPKAIETIYRGLPASKIEQIDKRDGRR